MICFLEICSRHSRSFSLELECTIYTLSQFSLILSITHPTIVLLIPYTVDTLLLFYDLQCTVADLLLEGIRTLAKSVRQSAREHDTTEVVCLNYLTNVQLYNLCRFTIEQTYSREVLTYRTHHLLTLFVEDRLTFSIHCRNLSSQYKQIFCCRYIETIAYLVGNSQGVKLLISQDTVDRCSYNLRFCFCHF